MKTEYEKMLAGENYNPADPEIRAAFMHGHRLLHRLNHSEPDADAERKAIIHALLGSHGEKPYIEPPFYCDYGSQIHVGDNFYANCHCVLLDVCDIRIGDNVMLAPKVQILTASHSLDATERNSGVEFGKPINIGNNVWLGAGAIICPGVTIGDNAVVAAGAVVIRDVPSHVLVGGNPAKMIRKL